MVKGQKRVKNLRKTPKVNVVDQLAVAVLILSGLNWALKGLMDLDIVSYYFGEMSPMSRFIYLSTGIIALYALITFRQKIREYNS